MRYRPPREPGRNAGRAGMTLIELIIVLGLLSVVVALAAPALSPFFRGRRLNEEARRMLALTRYARSEAVSRSVPMELWIDPETGDYGLRPQAGYESDDDKEPIEFHLGDGLGIAVDNSLLDKDSTAKILFQPDGAIDDESLEKVVIQETESDKALELERVDSGRGYEIKDVTGGNE